MIQPSKKLYYYFINCNTSTSFLIFFAIITKLKNQRLNLVLSYILNIFLQHCIFFFPSKLYRTALIISQIDNVKITAQLFILYKTQNIGIGWVTAFYQLEFQYKVVFESVYIFIYIVHSTKVQTSHLWMRYQRQWFFSINTASLRFI